MNATQLYDIVKTVPHAAWPTGLSLNKTYLRKGRISWMIRTAQVLPAHAELLFEASMTRYADEVLKHPVRVRKLDRYDGIWYYYDDGIQPPRVSGYSESRAKALAKALIELAVKDL